LPFSFWIFRGHIFLLLQGLETGVIFNWKLRVPCKRVAPRNGTCEGLGRAGPCAGLRGGEGVPGAGCAPWGSSLCPASCPVASHPSAPLGLPALPAWHPRHPARSAPLPGLASAKPPPSRCPPARLSGEPGEDWCARPPQKARNSLQREQFIRSSSPFHLKAAPRWVSALLCFLLSNTFYFCSV